MTICGRELYPNMAGNYVFTGLFKRLSAKITVRNLSYNIEKTGTYRSAFLSL